MAADLTSADRTFLLHLQTLALRYFVDNQTSDGFYLDRQHNFGARTAEAWRSTSATGMGLIAVALASAEPFRLLTRRQAIARATHSLRTAVENAPHDHGILSHFADANGKPVGFDVHSTVDTAWLVAGALWAAAFLGDAELQDLTEQLYRRIDWGYWTTPAHTSKPGLIRHGADRRGFLPNAWDRLNGETIFLYVLAAGAEANLAWPTAGWSQLQHCIGITGGLQFISADLGLFVFQYGLDLVDSEAWHEPGGLDLFAQAAIATEANYQCCRAASDRYATYRSYWGLSAGDGPGDGNMDTYRCYSPHERLDGTAHITATLASIAHRPEIILENARRARRDPLGPLGRYGFSNINLDRSWVGRDIVGIDAGAAVLALDNFLADNRVRDTFHNLPCVRRGLERLAFQHVGCARPAAANAPLPIAS
jgi:hypothetical protein